MSFAFSLLHSLFFLIDIYFVYSVTDFHTTSKRLADEKETPPLEKYEDECWTDYGSGGETDEEDRCLVEAFTSIQELEMKEEQISLEIAKLQKGIKKNNSINDFCPTFFVLQRKQEFKKCKPAFGCGIFSKDTEWQLEKCSTPC